MKRYAHAFRGRCHCGNLETCLNTDRAAAELPTRNCGCGFCRRHGSRTVTDPDGLAVITLHRPDGIHFYRFAFRTADFLICRECGVYGAALMAGDGGAQLATLNVNLFCNRNEFPPPASADYGSETETQRRLRRMRNWTPAHIAEGA